ncbi:MAG TPA: universal stress protein [Oceanospirillales bacterium]|nr:universal stress protein [Oceanospirillales bacterium]
MSEKYILVGIDGSAISDDLIQYAIWLSQSNALPIKLLHTIEHSHQSENAHHEGNLTPNIRRELLQELSEEERQQSKVLLAKGKALINTAKQKVLDAGIQSVVTQLRHGTLPEAVADLADEIALLMLGSKGKDHKDDEKGLGYHLEQAIKATDKPVFIAKKTFSQPKKVLFAYNGSPTSKRALAMLTKDTIYKEALEVHVVCVNNDQQLAKSLVDEAQQALSKTNHVVTKVLTGDTITQLTAYQQENAIDITVMGAFSHGKLHGFFFGSFTVKMIQQSETNFLLIR